MTLNEVCNLTPNHLRVELAKALAWKYDYEWWPPGKVFDRTKRWGWFGDRKTYWDNSLPDWPSNLNAVACDLWSEVQRRERGAEYICALLDVLETGISADGAENLCFGDIWCMIQATALQHSQAALVALTGEKKDDIAEKQRATNFVGLFTTMPAADGTGGVEPTGGGYIRKAITFDAPAVATPTGRQITQSATVDFNEATGNWGTLINWRLIDERSMPAMYRNI